MATLDDKCVEAKEDIVSLDSDINSDKTKGTIYLLVNNKKYEVERKNLLISKLMTKVIMDTMIEENTVPIPSITNEKTMENLLTIINHYHGTEGKIPQQPLRSKILREFLDEWEAVTYEKFNNQELYDLILVANYLDIKFLLHQLCAVVASKIKGQSLDKIKEILSDGLPKKEESKESKE
jgi:S-phase kinase-associated protein 1